MHFDFFCCSSFARFVKEEKRHQKYAPQPCFGSIYFHTHLQRTRVWRTHHQFGYVPSSFCVHRYFIFCYLNMEKDHLSNGIVSNFTQFQRQTAIETLKYLCSVFSFAAFPFQRFFGCFFFHSEFYRNSSTSNRRKTV